MNSNPKIYRYNDDISFRICSLSDVGDTYATGDCTNYSRVEFDWGLCYICNQHGIHLHCTKHPETELKSTVSYNNCILSCPQCKNDIRIMDIDKVFQDCQKLLNIERFENAELIRLDDWYTPEKKQKVKLKSDYWIQVDVKTDKDNDTVIVLYIGKKHSKEKAQFFIQPEKLKLSHDHNDLDPASVISKIEVTLKDRILKQEYEEE